MTYGFPITIDHLDVALSDQEGAQYMDIISFNRDTYKHVLFTRIDFGSGTIFSISNWYGSIDLKAAMIFATTSSVRNSGHGWKISEAILVGRATSFWA